MMAIKSTSAQSSLTSIVGLVISMWLIFVALAYLVGSAEIVGERFRRAQMEDLALIISNDLIFNPGYEKGMIGWNGGLGKEDHPGLAHYDENANLVEYHVLDYGKVMALNESMLSRKDELRGMWNIEYNFSVGLESYSGEEYLEKRVDERDMVTVSRLVRIKEGNWEKNAILWLALY
ncbi:hypothetical protein ACFLQI_01460 [Candidatus Undinarchaeota archaeon]